MSQSSQTTQSQSTQGMNQVTFATPPTMVSTKDLSSVEDQMQWFLTAAKKCGHFANECTDPEVKTCISQIGKTHERHYQLLLQYLQTNNGSQNGAQTSPMVRH
jgi:hypothetical protein